MIWIFLSLTTEAEHVAIIYNYFDDYVFIKSIKSVNY